MVLSKPENLTLLITGSLEIQFMSELAHYYRNPSASLKSIS